MTRNFIRSYQNEYWTVLWPPAAGKRMPFAAQDTVCHPAGLRHWVAAAVRVELLQQRHGICIPDLHRVSCGHQTGDVVHGRHACARNNNKHLFFY